MALTKVTASMTNFAPYNALDYGVDPTGATNSTSAMKAFFDACIAQERGGNIPAGTYLITAGQLVFDNGFTDKNWPQITTNGYESVVFKRADATDEPMITLSNGTATSAAGNYWNGGCIGGITFDQNNKVTGSNQHSISLSGVYGIKFGWMRTNNAGGSCIYVPTKLFSGNNPDPYAISFCEFDGIEANRCLRYGLENQNWVGLTACTISALRVIECTLGGWYGLGAGNVCDIASMGSVGGWAFDDGTATANTGGSPSRITINIAELDDVQNGFRLNRMTQLAANQIRFVCRYNFGPLNPSGGYWPRTGISIAGGTLASSCADISISAIWRIEAGGTKPDVGVFTNMHGIASNSIFINNRVLDNASFGFANTDLFTGVTTSSVTVITNAGATIFDSFIKPYVLVRSATTETVPNAGYGTAAAKIVFATELSDRGNNYSSTDSWFTVPYGGLYRVNGRIALNIASGVLVRLGFATDTAGVIGTVLNRNAYQVTANPETYEINGVVSLVQGARLFLMAQQGTAGAVNLSAPASATADLTWSVEGL